MSNEDTVAGPGGTGQQEGVLSSTQHPQQQGGGGAAGFLSHFHLVPEVRQVPSSSPSSPWVGAILSPVLLGAVEAGALEDLTLKLGHHSARCALNANSMCMCAIMHTVCAGVILMQTVCAGVLLVQTVCAGVLLMQTVCAGEQLCSEACQIAHDKARTELRQRRSPGCPYTQVCAPSSPMHQLLCNKPHTLRQSPYTATPHRPHSFFPNALVAVEHAAHFQTSSLHCNTHRPHSFFPGALAAATASGLQLSRSLQQLHSLGSKGTTSSGSPPAAGGGGDAATSTTAPDDDAALSFAPPAHLAWVSDWRLRSALGSPLLWQDLLLQLRVVGCADVWTTSCVELLINY